jgi:hypothetical protein
MIHQPSATITSYEAIDLDIRVYQYNRDSLPSVSTEDPEPEPEPTQWLTCKTDSTCDDSDAC